MCWTLSCWYVDQVYVLYIWKMCLCDQIYNLDCVLSLLLLRVYCCLFGKDFIAQREQKRL